MTALFTDSNPAERVGATGPDGGDPGSNGIRALRRQAIAALVVFVLCVCLLGWSWARFDRVRHDPEQTDATARDAVVAATTKDVAALNTFDSAHVDDALAAWAGVTTGDLHDQMSRVSSKERKALAATRSVSTGQVPDVAVTDLDRSAGTAQALAFVTVAVQPAHGRPRLLRHRYRVELHDTSGSWLVASIAPIEVSGR